MNGPGSQTTSEIPEEWKPYINQVIGNAGQVMTNNPLYAGGPPAASGGIDGVGGAGGGDTTPTDPKSTTVRNPGGTGGTGGNDLPAPRPGGGRVVADVPIGGGSPPGGTWGPFVPYGPSASQQWDPSQGTMAWNPQNVAGPSGLENWAAGNATSLADPTEGGTKAAEMYSAGAAPVAGKSIAGTELFDSANQIFQDQIMGTIQNSKSLGGLSAGTGQASALGSGKAAYMMPLMQQVLGVMEGDAGRSLNAGQGYASLGRDESQREFAASENAMKIGGVGRGIRDQRNAADRDEFNRLAGISERVNLGPLASVLPASMGSTTTSTKF